MTSHETLIHHYNRLNGNSITRERLKHFHAQMQKALDANGHGPLVKDLRGIFTRLTNFLKNNDSDFIIDRVEVVPINIQKAESQEVRSKKVVVSKKVEGIEKVKSKSKKKLPKKTSGKAVKPENKSLVKAPKPSHPQEGAALPSPSLPRVSSGERAGVRSHEIKKHFAKELKKKVFGQKKSKSKSLSGVNYNYHQIDLGPYQQDFHLMFSDSIVQYHGLPGHGKTTYVLKLTKHLSQKYKVLYVAREEYGRSVFDMKLKENQLSESKNIRFRRKLEKEDIQWADIIFLDSVNALKLSHEDVEDLAIEYPNRNWHLIMQSTKDGSFRGSQEWEHLVDIAGEVRNRNLILRKNRLDPNNSTKMNTLLKDDAIEEAKKRAEIRKAVKESIAPKPVPVTIQI